MFIGWSTLTTFSTHTHTHTQKQIMRISETLRDAPKPKPELK